MTSVRRAAKPNSEELNERVHALLYEQVGFAVEAVAHMETTWSEAEMTKRIVKYMWKPAQNEDLRKLDLEKFVDQLIQSFMGAYHPSCGDKDWFFEIDLSPAFTAIVWEILNASSRLRGGTQASVQQKVLKVYNEKLDALLLQKAQWEAVAASFSDPAVQNKMFQSIAKTYDAALQQTKSDPRRMERLQRVEDFLKRWMDASMSRAWCALDGGSVTEANVIRLFQNLLTPFGEEHQFSCVPVCLTQEVGIGPPPKKWAYVAKAARALFATWGRQASVGPSKRRKKSGGGAVDDVVENVSFKTQAKVEVQAEPEAEDDVDEDVVTNEALDEELDEVAGEGGGHPDCTSAEDCIGSPEDGLVQHLLNGNKGDIYCCRCFQSFLESNPTLVGEDI